LVSLAAFFSIFFLLFSACHTSSESVENSGGFIKRFLIPEGFNGTVVVIWDVDTAKQVKTLHENFTILLLEIPPGGILYTSTKPPENASCIIEIYEQDGQKQLMNEEQYKVHPSSGSFGAFDCYKNGENTKKFFYDVLYVSKQFYKYPDEDEKWKKERVTYQKNVDTLVNSLCWH
jgi:hypothetical protein